MSLSSKEQVELMVKALDSKHGIDITAIDLNGLTTLGDYFVVASGKSNVQVKALAEEIENQMTKAGYEPRRKEGYQSAVWVLLDYGDIIAHIFHHETRDFYSLERLWGDAPRVDLSDILDTAKD